MSNPNDLGWSKSNECKAIDTCTKCRVWHEKPT